MLRYGTEPFLECSSMGDKRFSAFYAHIKQFNNTIENLYQAYKIFDDGRTGLHWREAKGKKPINFQECVDYYSYLWDTYIQENPHLLKVLDQYNGVSDIYGQKGHQCQATELWRIKHDIMFKFL